MNEKERSSDATGESRPVTPDEEEKKFEAAVLEGLHLFDELIQSYYEELKNNVSKYCRTGDFIKMVDLRYRLSPTRVEQKEFWEKLARIRQQVLAKKAAKQKPQENQKQEK